MQSAANHLRAASFKHPGVIHGRTVETTSPAREVKPAQHQPATTVGVSNNQIDVIPHARVEALRTLTLALLREIVALSELSESAEGGGLNLACEVQRFEADMIRMALVQTAGKQRRAARLLGVKITTLHRKIKHYQINIEEIQKEAALLREPAK